MTDGDNVSPPPAEAVAAARAYARMAADGEDPLLAGMTAAAIALGEAFLGQRLLVGEVSATVRADGRWQLLPAEPVTAIGAVSDAAGIPLPADAYATDIGADGRGWVRARAGAPVRVRYTAGLAAEWVSLPAPIAQGVAMLAAHLLDAREGAAPPAAVSALWRPWRQVRL